jgi:type I site-specific restriction endonuclease
MSIMTKTTNKEGNMKPIRSNELEHYKEEINKKFRYKAQAIESEIQQEAQTLSDKKKPSFQKLVKVDKKMANLIEAEKKYKKHLMNKDAIERKLLEDVRKKAKEVEDHCNRVKNVRDWSDSFSGYSSRHEIDDQASDYFISQLNDACYQEALKHITQNHKLRQILESKRELAYNILYSGGDINAILSELVKAFKSADIEYAVPSSLLQLSK